MYKYKYKYKYANMNENLIQSYKQGTHIFENPSIAQQSKKIEIENRGLFVSRFNVEFDLLGLPMYSPFAKDITIGNSGARTIPTNASNVKVIIRAVGGGSCDRRPNTFPACYRISGTTLSVKCIDCPKLSNTSDYEKESFVSQQEQPNPCTGWNNTDLDLRRPNYFFEHTNAEGDYFKLYSPNKERSPLNKCNLNAEWTNRISSIIVAPNTYVALCIKNCSTGDPNYLDFINNRSDRHGFYNIPDYGKNDFNSVIQMARLQG